MSSDELSTRQVPIEIIETILANVASVTGPDLKAALYACSMASSEMAYCTRPHIFRKVTFHYHRRRPSARCQQFLEIVAANPNIPIYIKECHIKDCQISSIKRQPVFLGDPLFPSVLDALKNVQHFELTIDSSRDTAYGYRLFYWDHFEENMKHAFHGFFNSVQITHVFFEKINFPPEFAEYLLCFKSVELNSCSFGPNLVDICTSSTHATRLEKFTFPI